MNSLYRKYDAKKVGKTCFATCIIIYVINFILSLIFFNAMNIINTVLSCLAGTFMLIYVYKYMGENNNFFFILGTSVYTLLSAITFFETLVSQMRAMANNFQFGTFFSMLLNLTLSAYTVAILIFAILIALKGTKKSNTQIVMDVLFLIYGAIAILDMLAYLTNMVIAGASGRLPVGDTIVAFISGLLNLISAIALTTGYLFTNKHIILSYQSQECETQEKTKRNKKKPNKK